LQVGQMMSLEFDSSRQLISYPITKVEPEILSPAAVRRRFDLSGIEVPPAAQPVAVAMAQFEPNPAGLPASSYIGRVYPVKVEVESRRVISLVPVIAQWFGETQ
jgi:hypothetical protein